MSDNSSRERDLVLSPNEYAFIADQTKGNINVYVGPYKTSLANTDQPVSFNEATKRFEHSSLDKTIKTFAIAPEGWYSVLKNPAKENNHPTTGTINNLIDLTIGSKINIPGPVSFSLWPGQMVKILKGHLLKSNQYLVARVYDEEAAKANWKSAVIKPQTNTEEEIDSSISKEKIPDLTMGKLLLIKGTEISFYIPPTGIEVLRDETGNYVRNAVTLEKLEYCILLDETGSKRFIHGSAVVFPEPTEDFVYKNKKKKFKAIELNEISGIYIKIISSYTEDGKEYKTGNELFITGKDQMIYYPRPEHAIVKYGSREIHYAVAIPSGEGRYVLDRITGKISLKNGPCMFLPDPRKEVIIRRILEETQIKTWFPGNIDAIKYNNSLRRNEIDKNPGSAAFHSEFLTETVYDADLPAVNSFAGDDFERNQNFLEPRTITLDNKYDGAVSIDVWTGYAILVVSKTGTRKIVTGPDTCLLEYDEALETMELSTGTPKNDDRRINTAYLRVLHNKISDIIEVETSDFCRVKIKLSYRVNFEENSELWFNVENYVKFLTDHMRSLVRKSIKKIGIEEFHSDSINILRDVILGVAGEKGVRPGRKFDENNMRIYDVEILESVIGDSVIEKMLISAQHEIVEKTLSLTSKKRNLEFIKENEVIKQNIAQAEFDTRKKEISINLEELKDSLNLNLSKIENEVKIKQEKFEGEMLHQEIMGKINSTEIARRKENINLELETAQAKLKQRIQEIQAEVQAMVDKAEAVSPDLIAALQAFGDKALAEKMAETMAPLAILGGSSVADVFSNLLQGTNLEEVIKTKFLTKQD